MFKIYLRVFKILFKGVQHLYNTYIIIIFFFPFVFNTSGCAIAHPHLYVEPPLNVNIATSFKILNNMVVYTMLNL
jgi:hypothetical protein